MRSFSRISLLLLMCSLASVWAKAQVTWAPMPFDMKTVPQFFWVDSTDSTLYVSAFNLTAVDNMPCRWGFRYRKGVVSRLPFQDSLRGCPIAMQRYQGKLYVSDGSSLGYYDSTGWHTIVPYYPPAITTGACVMRLYPYQGKLLVAGVFDNIMGTGIGAIAQWDGTSFNDFHNAGAFIPSGWAVSSIVEYKGNVVIAGNFDLPGGINDIAQWDGQQWRDVGGSIGGGGMEGVGSLLIRGDDLYVAGGFTEVAGCPGNNIARWDGQRWHRLAGGVSQSDGVSGLIAVGDTLVAVGYFSVVDGQPGYGYARYYNGRWCPNTDPLDYAGTSVVNYYDTLFMGGTFSHIGNQPARYMARVVSQSDCLSTLSAAALPEQAAGFSLSPNPSRGQVAVQSPQAGELRLSDVAGRVLLRQPVQKGLTKLQLPAALTGGIYLVEIKAADGSRKAARLQYEP